VFAGKVLAAQTREPVSFASVFFDGTFLGTFSDEEGNFKLDVEDFLSRSLKISTLASIPYSLESLDPGKNYTVLLIRDCYNWNGKMPTPRIADFLPYEYSVGR
jgi:hypothetical protein